MHELPTTTTSSVEATGVAIPPGARGVVIMDMANRVFKLPGFDGN